MGKKLNKQQLICSGTPDKKCNVKSKGESSIKVAFDKAEKEGWTKEQLTEKCVKYYCPSCSHKKNIKKVA